MKYVKTTDSIILTENGIMKQIPKESEDFNQASYALSINDMASLSTLMYNDLTFKNDDIIIEDNEVLYNGQYFVIKEIHNLYQMSKKVLGWKPQYLVDFIKNCLNNPFDIKLFLFSEDSWFNYVGDGRLLLVKQSDGERPGKHYDRTRKILGLKEIADENIEKQMVLVRFSDINENWEMESYEAFVPKLEETNNSFFTALKNHNFYFTTVDKTN